MFLAHRLIMCFERKCLKYSDRHFYLNWLKSRDSQFNHSLGHERLLEITDLFSMEISVLVTVGYGDCKEIIMCAGI